MQRSDGAQTSDRIAMVVRLDLARVAFTGGHGGWVNWVRWGGLEGLWKQKQLDISAGNMCEGSALACCTSRPVNRRHGEGAPAYDCPFLDATPPSNLPLLASPVHLHDLNSHPQYSVPTHLEQNLFQLFRTLCQLLFRPLLSCAP